MIGVDIIDLSCSFDPLKHSLEDYKKRILNKTEFLFCQTFDELHMLWAIKESVYKCYFKNTGSFFINPKRILITHIDIGSGMFYANIEQMFYTGTYRVDKGYVYAICFSNSACLKSTQVFISQAARTGGEDIELAYFFKELGSEASFTTHKDGFSDGIQINGNRYGYSRSHHGAYYISVITPVTHN